MFGGIAGSQTRDTRTYEWEGSTGLWSDRTPPIAAPIWPSARGGTELAYDPSTKTVMLFGGADASGYRNDLWEWNGLDSATPWTLRTAGGVSTSAPSPRTNAQMVYDSVRGVMVVIGGSASDGFLQDVWEWTRSDGLWTARGKTPFSTGSFAATYDWTRSRVVALVGSPLGPSTGLLEVWEWSGSGGWLARLPPSPSATWPLARFAHSAQFDGARDRVLLFGGERYGSSGTLHPRETWEWDGAAGAWTERTPVGLPPEWPAPLSYVGLAHDTGRATIVAFGGLTPDPPLSGYVAISDTWEWNGTAGAWRNRTPADLPAAWPSRRIAPFEFDGGRGRGVMFGGFAGPELLADVWEWDGAE